LADEWVGRTIDGRYAIESMLGAGGMGVVLRARHKFTGAEVALKMLHSALHLDPALESRFLAEARASNQIGHPAIVQVLDAGRTPEGELYLVMELLLGEPLRDAVKRRLPPFEIKRIVGALLEALAAAHARGFVHRDLKPENVFLAAPNAAVKLLDFGIAKGVKSASIGLPRTRAGVLLGTLAYMAPEQLRDASTVDPRADLWAVGVLLYEMICGRLPFEAVSIEELYMKLARVEPDPITRWVPTISPAVEQFFTRALARDPYARFATAAEMSAAVMQLPLDAQPTSVTPRESRGDTQATQATFGVQPTYAAQTPTPNTPIPNTPVRNTPFPNTPVSRPPMVIAPHTPYPALPQTGPQPFVPQSPQTGPQPLLARETTDQVRKVRASRVLPFTLIGIALLAIVVAIAVATRQPEHRQVANRDASIGDASAPVITPITVVDAAAIDATEATVVHHKPHDAGVDATRKIDAGTAAPIDPYATAPPALDCVASCTWLNSCGLKSPTCVAECQKSNGYGGCLASAKNDCDKFAACFLAAGCGPVGRGAASCIDTLQCQLHCNPNDRTCACGCVANSAPGNLSELVAYNICTRACGQDKDCVARNCTAAYNKCKAQ